MIREKKTYSSSQSPYIGWKLDRRIADVLDDSSENNLWCTGFQGTYGG